MKYLEKIKVQIAIIVILELLSLVSAYFLPIDGKEMYVFAGMVIIHAIMLYWIISTNNRKQNEQDHDITRVLGYDAKEAMIKGKVALITFDDQYCATWVSDLLVKRGVDIVGKKLTSWVSDISKIINGEQEMITANVGDAVYEIIRKENGNVLYLRDITRFYHMNEKVLQDSVVAGLIQLDNYMEIQQYEDETMMSIINTALRQPIVEWANSYGMMIRRLRSDRFLVICSEKIFQKAYDEKFTILNLIRKKAEEIEVSITLSMSFAHGTDDYQLLDTMVNDLLELAQSRGGDQVAIKKFGENVKYFGGNSEAKEKRSKVRVRVMNQAFMEAVEEANRVFVLGHREMDFDCMGASLCVSIIAAAKGKSCYIVSKSGGVDAQLKATLLEKSDDLSMRHRFIDDIEASAAINDSDLVVVVDHNNPQQCGAPMSLAKAKRVVVIDHHRRSEKFISHPLLTYIETSASSTCELLSEFLQYQDKINIGVQDATIMYVGILVDTNRFRFRTNSRTFEAVSYLRKNGADPNEAENMLRERYEDFVMKSRIIQNAIPMLNKILISPVSEDVIVSRTLMSQAADELLDIKGMEASFVIARINDVEAAISARSKGEFNVQIILEKMNGGGHFNAAGLQRVGSSVKELQSELIDCIKEYFEENKEEDQSESNIIS